ncbi:hypothetical protein BGX24_011269, partial [Mortierella sp. AD032]
MDKSERGNTPTPADLYIRAGDKFENSRSNRQSEPSVAVAPQSTSLADFRPINHGPSSFTPIEPMNLYDPEAPERLEAYGGVPIVLAGLHANSTKGSTANKPFTSVVTSDEKVEHHHQAADINVTTPDREQVYGRNVPPKRILKIIFQLLWMALQEKILHPTLASATSSTSSDTNTITKTSTITSSNTIPKQQFKYQGNIQSQYVHYDETWKYHYSCLDDLQDNFSGAKQFRVRGDNVIFRRDENNKNKRHDPPRIPYYPDDIIEIIAASGSPDSSITSESALASAFNEPHLKRPQPKPRPQHQYYPSQQPQQRPIMSPSADIVAVLTQSEQGRTVLRPTSENRAASNITAEIQQVHALFARASADPDTLKKEIEDNNFHISTATNRDSDEYLGHLSNLMHQQKVVIEQNHQYQTLQHQQTHHLQHHALSKLEVMDRKLNAILVQNYELHEYTVPRFFVVLPESFDKWDPRSLMMCKYRLYFLCECDAHATYQHGSSISLGSPASLASHRRVHLHNHKGYSFSRPDEFMERFGPYVIGMLKILSYCLRAATIAAPATGLISEAVQDTMQGIEAIAKNTLENVINNSISFLKQNLDKSGVTASSPSSNTNVSELDDPFQSVVALEGADLRRLKTFLRYSDGDETL